MGGAKRQYTINNAQLLILRGDTGESWNNLKLDLIKWTVKDEDHKKALHNKVRFHTDGGRRKSVVTK